MKVSPLAGKPPGPGMLVNVPRLITAYYAEVPDPAAPPQRVAFGTSGNRGSSLEKAFNEWHILAISQAICLYRKQYQIDSPMFLGMDTHALSVPAMASSLEVLAANGVDVMEVALAVTRAGNLFTTHTAVAAGFDRFAPALIEQYLGGYAEQKLGITLHDLLALGRQNPNDSSAAPLPRTARYAMLNLS